MIMEVEEGKEVKEVEELHAEQRGASGGGFRVSLRGRASRRAMLAFRPASRARRGDGLVRRCGASERLASVAALVTPRSGVRVLSRRGSRVRNGCWRAAALCEKVRHRRCGSGRATPGFAAGWAAGGPMRVPNRNA